MNAASTPALAALTRELAAVATLPVRDLRRRLAQLLGRPVHSNNRAYLIRKLSWHVRDQAEGHPAPRTLQELLAAGPAALPERWRERFVAAGGTRQATLPVPPAVSPDRDPRLPPAGATLGRAFRGTNHEVVVHEADFEYRGVRYRSLSAVARVITGTRWNGMVFFGLGGEARA